jgi:hypothetical protein
LNWYREAREVVNQASHVSIHFNKAFRESFLVEILRKISSLPALPIRYDSIDSDTEGAGAGDEEEEDRFGAKKKGKSGPKLPKVPLVHKDVFSLHHIPRFGPLSVMFESLTNELICTKFPDVSPHGKSFIMYAEEANRMMELVRCHLDVVPLLEKLRADEEKHAAESDPTADLVLTEISKPVLKLCCLCDDSLLHRFLCNYVQVQNRLGSRLLGDLLDVKVYLIPIKNNTLAQYIAQKDAWYRRQIFSPFSQLQLVPELSWSGNIEMEFPEFSPVHQTKYLMEDYFRAAQHQLKVNVYQCECWVLLNNSVEPDIVIPFCVNVQLGINVDFAKYRSTVPRSVDENISGSQSSLWDSILLDKAFTKQTNVGTTPDVKIKYVKMDLNGAVDAVETELPVSSYGHICMGNLPNYSETVVTATDPEAPWLCFNSLPSTHKKYNSFLRKAEKTQKDIGKIFCFVFLESG